MESLTYSRVMVHRYFVPFEVTFLGWAVSHAMVNDWLQTILLIVSIIAGIIGIYRAVTNKKKK